MPLLPLSASSSKYITAEKDFDKAGHTNRTANSERTAMINRSTDKKVPTFLKVSKRK
jgi:hypothetical protein